MSKDYKDLPASESSVTLKLALIQKRCSELLDEGDEFGGLSLEEPVQEFEDTNPYNRG